MSRPLLAWLALGALPVLVSPPAEAQNLGHKVLGGVGLDAGRQEDPGLYVANRSLYYAAREVKNRNGDRLAVSGLDIDVFGNVTALSTTFKLRWSPYLSVAFGFPLAHVSLNSTEPLASVDRFGVGDIFVQPLKLGWRFTRLELVTSYIFYAPTGAFEPGSSSVGQGQWTHQFSAGGTVYFDSAKRWRISLLTSYNLNQRKQKIDITRGDTLQIQGGAGMRLFRVLNFGVAWYMLWQVRDDRGADLPAPLRGAREQVYGLGPELTVDILSIRMRVGLRYEWDFAARARPEGQILVATVSWLAWHLPAFLAAQQGEASASQPR